MVVSKEDVENCISQGMRNKEIYEFLNISKSTLLRLCKSYGLSLDRRASLDTYQNLTFDKIKELADSGFTLDLAAETMGVSRSHFAKKAAESNISFVKRKFNQEEYLILKSKGMLDKDIATVFGMTPHGLHGSKVSVGLPIESRNFETISKETLVELYQDKKVPIIEISRLLNKGLTAIYTLLGKYSIKLRRDDGVFVKKELLKGLIDSESSFFEMAELFRTSEDAVKKALIINDLDSEELFSSEGLSLNRFTEKQKQLIYGSMLGDAHCGNSDGNQRIRFTHGLKQKDYIEHKLKVLDNFVAPRGLQLNPRLDKRTNKIHISVAFETVKSRIFSDLMPLFYNPEKYIHEDVLYYLDGLGLSYWFMDDGYKYGNSALVLCTECFANEDLNKTVLYFKIKWDINCEIESKERRIYFCDEEGLKFQRLVEPHMLPYFNYKLLTNRKRPNCDKKATLVSVI